MVRVLLAAVLMHVAFIHPSLAMAAEPVVLQYGQRPPFMGRDAGGNVTGILVAPAIAAFAKAGIPIVWSESSPPRQLAIIQANNSRTCALGRYKTPERAAYARFTKSFYQDAPSVAVANLNFKVPDNIRAADLMADPSLTVLFKNDILLGPYTQDLIAHMKAKQVGTGESYEQMIKMVVAGRAQFAFISGEEEGYYRDKLGAAAKEFRILHFSDMPPGEKRYIMCSKMIDEAEIEKINAGLK